MAGRYCEGKIKMASEKVSRKMVLEIKYINANNNNNNNFISIALFSYAQGALQSCKTTVKINIYKFTTIS